MDQRILLALHEHATPLFDAVFRLSHQLGTDLFLALIVVALAAFHRLRGERREALAWLAIGLATLLLVEGLKAAVGRPRPLLWPRLVEARGFSFPSGHALGSAALYGFLAHTLARRWPKRRLALCAGAALMALYVGGGRLYLGVHWPSDVLAGWALGALLCIVAARALEGGGGARGLRPASPDALQARLNSVFEYGADVVALLDRRGRVLHASRSTSRVLGHELPDFVGRAALEFVHPDDQDAAQRGFLECLARPGVPLPGQLRMRHRNGEWRILEGVAIDLLADPNVAALVVNYRDVTERHAVEQALQASEERYRDLVERSLAGVYVTDFAGRMLSCNQALARMLGHDSPAEVIGRQDTEFMAEPQLRLRTLARLQERGSLVGFEAALLKKDSQPLWVLGSANLVRGPDGAPRLVEGTLIDVTGRRRAEEQARDLDKLKRNFMTVASHEMRSPLTVILGYVEMLLDMGLDPLSPRQRGFLEICRGSLERIATIVNNMTRILAVEESRVRLSRTSIDLRRLLDDVVREVAPFVERRGQRLVVEGPASVVAEADAGKVRTALQALVENAIKFTPDGGAITVTVGTGDDEVRVDVVDEGIGIELHELPLVFEKFYAGADPTHHSSGRYQFKARGPGLGLAIAKGYVEAHGGRIWAESRGTGAGTAFHVVLPRHAPLTASASAA